MAMTILDVDDSATMLMSLKTGLSISGFNDASANCGQAALDKLKLGIKPDLILTDINMPGMTGLEPIGKVRALSGFRFPPILTLTTESETSKREEGKRLGRPVGWSNHSPAMIGSKSSSKFCLESKKMASARHSYRPAISPHQADLPPDHPVTREVES
jgi:two-component system chemotaxis response regulator CheY